MLCFHTFARSWVISVSDHLSNEINPGLCYVKCLYFVLILFAVQVKNGHLRPLCVATHYDAFWRIFKDEEFAAKKNNPSSLNLTPWLYSQVHICMFWRTCIILDRAANWSGAHATHWFKKGFFPQCSMKCGHKHRLVSPLMRCSRNIYSPFGCWGQKVAI